MVDPLEEGVVSDKTLLERLHRRQVQRTCWRSEAGGPEASR
jgi:hypothetical protein